jgi:hypothetical protein
MKQLKTIMYLDGGEIGWGDWGITRWVLSGGFPQRGLREVPDAAAQTFGKLEC